MKRTTLWIIILASLVVTLSILTAFAAASSVSAQLGNTGIPVRCTYPVGFTSPPFTPDLTCYRPDDTWFTTIPSNSYLLVTDIDAVPMSGSVATWSYFVCRYAGTTKKACVGSTTDSRQSFGQHFTSPILVFGPGDRINVQNTSDTGGAIWIYVSGLLTTNYTYMPLISR